MVLLSSFKLKSSCEFGGGFLWGFVSFLAKFHFGDTTHIISINKTLISLILRPLVTLNTFLGHSEAVKSGPL